MSDAIVDELTADLLEWLATQDRTYQEVIDVWRTFSPRFPVWEDAKDRGFVAQDNFNGCEIVRISSAGFAFLQQRKTSQSSAASRPA
jgi:hypothetical protein